MNCGRIATKKIAIFGLRMFDSTPCMNGERSPFAFAAPATGIG